MDDVTFKIKRGETLGLVGESGCGKTTVGRALLRLIEPTAGEVIFDGKNITNMPLKELKQYRKQMQIIFQDPYSSLNPRITVGGMLTEILKFHEIAEGDAAEKELNNFSILSDSEKFMQEDIRMSFPAVRGRESELQGLYL